MKNKLKNLTSNNYIIDYWFDEIKKLDKKDIEINITDFDYTLFSRDEQLEKEQYLRENRGDLGPKAIAKNGGINNYIKKYYLNKNFPKNILEKFDIRYDLVLTAGIYEFQVAKLIACDLDKYNFVITKNGEEKILELIKYIIYKLKFIPSKITVYEDRPKSFIEYRDLIEEVLGTKLEIMYVKMDGNNGYKKIEKV
ncbi:MAG: hypothetical protein Q9M94_05095 [Candidatus Gracilibacteria bacterium]|nr:hypothetical protein [Candidatus Gracilibacteria bacterium]